METSISSKLDDSGVFLPQEIRLKISIPKMIILTFVFLKNCRQRQSV
jgi:hypothetical protein